MPSPCRISSVHPLTSNCRPQGGHPCIERMRDAHERSNILRPLQRRFKARKKPEGYTSTPTGLKRLRTQNTAFRDNENGKGTPSGVPQPIYKRKLILVKEEFDASSFGGPEGIRTLDLSDANRTLSQLSYKPGYGKMGWNKLVPPHHYTHFCGKCKCFIPLSGALPSRRRSGGTEPRARPRPLRCAAPSSSGRTWRPRRPSRTPSLRRPR